MKDELCLLQKWYASQCNGEWEHSFGVNIETLDNPGWSVRIDLIETSCFEHVIVPLDRDNGDLDWIKCYVEDGTYFGRGDSTKLVEIISHFLTEIGAIKE